MTWIKVGSKPHPHCQTFHQKFYGLKGQGCQWCNWTGLEDVGFQSF